MVLFESSNPFPLHAEGSISYAEEKSHAEAVDHWLGFRISEVEDRLRQMVPESDWPETWIGLPQESLQTPYIEIRRILEQLELPPDASIADIGCAYGRIAHVLAVVRPHAHFVGMDVVESRIQEAKRVGDVRGLRRAQWILADFRDATFQPPTADFFFIYDSSTTHALERLLQKLREHAETTRITVVGRGRRIRDLIERAEPWLSQVHPPQHQKNFSIYRS